MKQVTSSAIMRHRKVERYVQSFELKPGIRQTKHSSLLSLIPYIFCIEIHHIWKEASFPLKTVNTDEWGK